jgi:hypothetical protein
MVVYISVSIDFSFSTLHQLLPSSLSLLSYPQIYLSTKYTAAAAVITMAGTAQQDPFYIVDIGAQKWPVILIPEDLLISEDKVALPIDDLIFPVLAVERNDMLVTGYKK